mgnify:CR=1 FL=1|tara:strand:- start:1962 stop:2585 length:624 start_codon:yes stop_codon:yes gene_type:complete
MNLENYYWFFRRALSDRFCDEIVKFGEEQKELTATTGGYADPNDLTPKQKKELERKRKSNVVWMDQAWIFNEIHPYVREANRNAGWNFQWDLSESCQFTKYKLNQFYDWHCDSWEKPYNDPKSSYHGKARKLSLILSLVDGSNYEGGDLQVDFRDKNDGQNSPRSIRELRQKGTIIVFPSFVWHRVTPVTKGTRYSLVCWHLGNPFI